jgi:hypothetical protein
MSRIGIIIEGRGEEPAVPLLVRKLIGHFNLPSTEVDRPIRIRRSDLEFDASGKPRSDKLARALVFLAKKKDLNAILILADADHDRTCELAPKIHAYASTIVAHRRIGVVLAMREYEAWFLASLSSLRGIRGIRTDAEPPDKPESMRGAKAKLESYMTHGSTYSPRTDQPALTESLDIELARRAYSFDKLARECVRLLR